LYCLLVLEWDIQHMHLVQYRRLIVPQPRRKPQAPTQPAITPTPTHTPKWTTVQTITGSGNKKTGVFGTPDDWKIVWSCNPSSFSNIQYNLVVDVYGSDNSTVDPGAINILCKPNNTSGETEEHQGGQVYLDIQSEGDWKIQVQELK
jgi:hypothetical protein